MKKVEDMTISEIKSLKRQYAKELCDVLKNFFEKRPLIESVLLYKKFGGYFYIGAGGDSNYSISNICISGDDNLGMD